MTTGRPQLEPDGIARAEHAALDEAQPAATAVASSDLGSDREEQLVEEPFADEITDEVGATLDQPGGTPAARRRRAPVGVVTTRVERSAVRKTGSRRSRSPFAVTITFCGLAGLPRAARSARNCIAPEGKICWAVQR